MVPDRIPRGYRSAVLAAFGWLILANAALPSEHQGPVSEQGRTESRQQAAGPNPNADQRQRPATEPRLTQEQEETERARQREDASDRHDKADLIEQRRAADAATRSADYVVLQTWIGSIGIILLVGTLLWQIKATNAATRAVEAQLSIERGRLTVVLSNQTSRVQDGIAVLDFVVCNTGKTDAVMWAFVFKSTPTKDFGYYAAKGHVLSVDTRLLGGNGGREKLASLRFPASTSGRRYIGCMFQYVTPIDGRHYMQEFCLDIKGPDPNDPNNLLWEFVADGGWPNEEREVKPYPWYKEAWWKARHRLRTLGRSR